VPATPPGVVVAVRKKPYSSPEEKRASGFSPVADGLLILAIRQAGPGMIRSSNRMGSIWTTSIIVDRASPLIGGTTWLPIIDEYETAIHQLGIFGSPVFAICRCPSALGAEKPGWTMWRPDPTGAGSWGEKDLKRLKKGDGRAESRDNQPALGGCAQPSRPRTGAGRTHVVSGFRLRLQRAIDPSRSVNQDLFLNAVNASELRRPDLHPASLAQPTRDASGWAVDARLRPGGRGISPGHPGRGIGSGGGRRTRVSWRIRRSFLALV